jgi:hypothetical protein
MVFVTEMIISKVEIIISDTKTKVSHSEMIISDIRTLVCGSEMIIADLRTSVYGLEMIISNTPTAVLLMEALIPVVEKMVPRAEIIISVPDIAFSVSKKTVGGAPAVVFHNRPTNHLMRYCYASSPPCCGPVQETARKQPVACAAPPTIPASPTPTVDHKALQAAAEAPVAATTGAFFYGR